MFRNLNFIWKYLSGFLLIAAVFMCFHGEAFEQSGRADAECEYLPSGEYSIKIAYTDTDGSRDFTLVAESLVTTENKQGVVLYEGEAPVGSGTLQFTVDVPVDARNVVLRSDGGIVEWKIQSVRLMCYDNYLLALLFFLLSVFVFLYGGLLYRKEHNIILCLVGLGILASLPLFSNYLIVGNDTRFHLARINGIYEGLRTGQFPVRINPVQMEGYGYLSGSLYPHLFLYFPAILKFFHISTMLGMKLLLLAANLATAILSYYAVRGICRYNRIALMAAVLYTFNPYRLINFYSRGAVGESLAMVFLPLVLWGTYEILWARREKWWILALGMIGVLNSHIVSLELYTMLIFLEMIIWAFSKKRDLFWKRVLALGKAALFTIIVNLYFLAPFLVYSQEELVCYDMKLPPALYVTDLIRAFEPLLWWTDGYMPLGMQGSMSVTLGSVILAGIILFVVYILKNESQSKEDLVLLGKHCLILGSVFFVVALWITPWESMMRIEWLKTVFGSIQFPWRTFGVSAFLFSIVTATAVSEWMRVQGKAYYLWPLLLCGIILECGSYYSQISQNAVTIAKMEADAENMTDDLYLTGHTLRPASYYYDTRFSHIMVDVNAHFAWIGDRLDGLDVICEEPDTVIWSNYTRNGLQISADVFVEDTEGSVEVSFPLHYYLGYRVLIDGEEVEVYSRLSMVTCLITSGKHHIEAAYVGLPLFRICDIITLLGIICPLAWQGILHLRKKKYGGKVGNV